MPPARGGRESAWVKKSAAGSQEKVPKEADDDETEGVTARKDGGKGKGRQKGERGRRETKERDGEDGGPVDGKSKSRGKGKGKKGKEGQNAAAEAHDKDRDSGDEDAGDETSSSALLKMLKANPPKVVRYSKSELLSFARLPASNTKPSNLSPLIDKDNKDSILLVRIAAARDKGEDVGKEDGGEAELEDGAVRRGRKPLQDRKPAEQGEAARAEAGAGATSVSSTLDPAQNLAAAGASPAEDGEAKTSRAYGKWFDRASKTTGKADAAELELPESRAATPAAPSTPGGSAANSDFAASMAAAMALGKAGSPSSPAAAKAAAFAQMLQQQAAAAGVGSATSAASNALAAQHAVQAAAYMQAMTNASAAAAAARAGSYPGQMPWGYNPYMNPYAGYGSHMDYAALQQHAAAAGLTEAMQAKLAAAQAASLSGNFNALSQLAAASQAAAARSFAKAPHAKMQSAAKAKAPGPKQAFPKMASPKLAPTSSPKLQASPKQKAAPDGPSAAEPLQPATKKAEAKAEVLAVPAKAGALEPGLTGMASAAPNGLSVGTGANDDEEAGCAQS